MLRLASVNLSCSTLERFINSIGITIGRFIDLHEIFEHPDNLIFKSDALSSINTNQRQVTLSLYLAKLSLFFSAAFSELTEHQI